MNVAPWLPLLDSMIDAVWLVDPLEFRIVGANAAALAMLEVERSELVGKYVVDLAATPEDQFFWEDVAAGLADRIYSDTLLLLKSGKTVPVERQVSKVALSSDTVAFVVVMSSKAEQRRVEQDLETLLAELRATLDSTADGILVTDTKGGIRGYNHRFAELWDMPQDLMTRRDDEATQLWMMRRVVDSDEYASRIGAIASSALKETRDIIMLRSGRVLERVSMPQLSRGRATGRVYSFRDITQQLANESRLELAAEVFESSLDPICVADPDGGVAAVNPSFAALTGLGIDQLKGEPIWSLIRSGKHGEFGRELLRSLDETNSWEGQGHCSSKFEGDVPVLISLVRVKSREQETLHYVVFLKDLTEQLAASRRIEELAYSDALTGLPNRILLDERIDFSLGLCARERKSFAIVFIDLDRFKQVNDSMGHVFGDRVLLEVAKRIKGCLRLSDTAARMGGDEFILLLHDTDAPGAEAMVQRVLHRLCEPIELDDLCLTLTSSIGIALYPLDGTSKEELVKNADTAMYQVKERGRAAFRFYHPQMNIDSLSRIKLDSAMRVALEQGQFRLRYQPQVDMDSGRVIGVEALLRWNSAELGEVSPAHFIPIAEETGFIVALGNWVLKEAIAQATRWAERGMDLVVAVNVSALQFNSHSFVDNVAEALAGTGVPAHRLELELTESILIGDLKDTQAKLRALADLGVRLSIDDFGTGYSSLAYLKRFPVQKLKIDRSFVNGLPDDESDLAIAGAIIQLGLALRLGVIAEGVETEAQRACLKTLGCHEYQGYLFAPALDVPALEARLTEQAAGAGSDTGPV